MHTHDRHTDRIKTLAKNTGSESLPVFLASVLILVIVNEDPSFLDCMTSSKLYRNRKQNFQALKPNVDCVTLAAGCSTPQVYNVNWVVPPAWYILQKWWGHVPPSS